MSRPRTFYDHLRELRFRLFVAGLAFLAGGVIGYVLRVPLLKILDHSSHQTLYYTSPTGAFNLVMKLSILWGVVFMLPVLTYNLLTFVQPAYHRLFTRKQLIFASLLSLTLAVSGALFAFYVIVPMSLNFFNGYKVTGIEPLISANDYLSFVTNHILTFVIIFQLPLLILLIDKMRPLPPRKFIKYERHVIIGSLIIALVLPFTYDPFTEFLVALPIIALYNLSIILVWLAHKTSRPPKPIPKPFAKHPVKPIPVPVPPAPVVTTPKRVAVMDVKRPRTARPAYVQSHNFIDLRKPEPKTE